LVLTNIELKDFNNEKAYCNNYNFCFCSYHGCGYGILSLEKVELPLIYCNIPASERKKS
jgi:hypothetical protein